MADDSGVSCGGVSAVVDADIRAADSGSLDLDEDVVVFVNLWFWHVNNF